MRWEFIGRICSDELAVPYIANYYIMPIFEMIMIINVLLKVDYVVAQRFHVNMRGVVGFFRLLIIIYFCYYFQFYTIVAISLTVYNSHNYHLLH